MSSMIQWCETPRPKREAAFADGLVGQRLLGQDNRMPRLQGDDGRPDLDARRGRADERGRRHDVELVGDLGRPDRVQAGLVGPAGVGLELLHLGGVAAAVGAHLQTHAHPGASFRSGNGVLRNSTSCYRQLLGTLDRILHCQ